MNTSPKERLAAVIARWNSTPPGVQYPASVDDSSPDAFEAAAILLTLPEDKRKAALVAISAVSDTWELERILRYVDLKQKIDCWHPAF